jgi:tyrosyl-tRNA synthetase
VFSFSTTRGLFPPDF